MGRMHAVMIQANRSGEEIVRGIYHQGDSIFGERADPFSRGVIVEEEEASIKGQGGPIVRKALLIRRQARRKWLLREVKYLK